MAAAPADFRPSAPSEYKIKKRPDGGVAPLELVQNPDILAGLGHAAPRDPNRVLVGFAAETGDDRSSILEAAREKLARKKCDLLVVNDVSGGAVFGSDDNAAVILTADGASRHVAQGPKSALAHAIWDAVYDQWRDRQG
jgi:phosphopantothenoylcysteine decarboxylase/phosphopantothenate--cysteine ligase